MNKEDVFKQLSNLKKREQVCWEMANVFLENRDAHGIHDMGVEIQALQRAIYELNYFITVMFPNEKT